jgi:hypothetical protein
VGCLRTRLAPDQLRRTPLSTADRPDGGDKIDRTITVESDQLELLALAVGALAAAAGDRGASDRMGDFYKRMERERTQEEIVAKCRSVLEIIGAALGSKA